MAEIVFSFVIVPTVATHLNIEGVMKEQAFGGQKRIDRVMGHYCRKSAQVATATAGRVSAPCDLTSSIVDGPNRAATLPEFIY
jgi:hypothetical protein